MNRQFVVWHKNTDKEKKNSKANQQWAVQLDECPHRLAPLSQGRVDQEDGCIECPYHGWKFNTEGSLMRVPQLEESQSLPQKSDVQSFPVHATGDILWAFLPTSIHGESFPRTLLPEDYYQGLASYTNNIFYTRDLPYSYDFLLENVVDGPAHLPFAHNNIGFARTDAVPVPIEILESNFTHFIYETMYTRKGQERKRRFGLQRPFLYSQEEQVGPDKWYPAILFFAVPIRERYSRLLTSLDKVPGQDGAPAWKMHMVNQEFFGTDIWLHDTEIAVRQKKLEPSPYLAPSSSDKGVVGFRRWWKKYGFADSPKHTFGPAAAKNLSRLSRKELTDPWTSHKKHCSICRTRLKQAQRMVQLSFGLAIAGTSLILRRHGQISGLLCIVTAWTLHRRSKRDVIALEGEHSPSRIPDRTIAAQ